MKWALTSIGISLALASAAHAQSYPSRKSAAKPQAIPVVEMTPVSGNCQTAAGVLNGKSNLPEAMDAALFKDSNAIKRVRARAKDGRLIVIKGGDFSGQKFGSDNFSNICFVGTKLHNTRWSKSRATGIGFINADLTGSTFDRVSMDSVLFRNSILATVDASGALMRNGRLDGGWDPKMTGLKLDYAHMNGFRFVCGSSSADGCSFDHKQMSMRGADLSGANLSSFSLWDTALADAKFDQTEISVDHLSLLNDALITGPIIIKADTKRVSLAPDAFRLVAAAAGKAQNVDTTECANPDTPLTQLLCGAGQSALKSYRDDINRLYANTLLQPGAAPAAPGATIVVTAVDKAHGRYQAEMRKCSLKEEDYAIQCLYKVMGKRRAKLIDQMLATRPLENDAHAIFVTANTPLLQAAASDSRLAGLTPLLIDAAPTMLLAYRDDDGKLYARGFGVAQDGQKCTLAFNPVGKKANRRDKGSLYFAWSTGAEFFIAPPEKKKQKRKKNQPPPPVATGCVSGVQSGPLVRLPITERDWDKIWATRKLDS